MKISEKVKSHDLVILGLIYFKLLILEIAYRDYGLVSLLVCGGSSLLGWCV